MNVALITGANKGIGYEIARRLGGTVLIGSRNAERGRAAEAALRADGADARFVLLDVTDPATVDAAAERIEAECGRLDVLVNNAAVSPPATHVAPSEVPLGELRQTFETNVLGVASVTNAMLPLLRRAPAARIVNVSSGLGSLALTSAGDFAGINLLAYNASKSALNAITIAYAQELHDTPIKVNSVSPGFCATDLNDHQGVLTAAQGAAAVIPATRLGPDGPTGTFFGADGPIPW